MNIVVAVDSFKGSLNALEAVQSIERGLRRAAPDANISLFPVADGGEGTTDAVLYSTGGRKIKKTVKNPLGDPIEAEFALLSGGTAVIEMAAASGLTLIEPHRRNPMIATTYGTGELIISALEHGANHIVLGLGGSATNDGGIGMASALGIKFLDESGAEVGLGGRALAQVESVDVTGITHLLNGAKIDIACDVENPLCGPFGAAYVFAAQKGASPEQIKELDDGLKKLARAVFCACGTDYADYKGAGAAGGTGVPLLAFCSAHLRSGIELVLDACRIDEKLKDADFVITGEGRVDSQTVFGKVPVGVARHAKKFSKPVIALTGSIGEGYEEIYKFGVDSVISIQNGPMTLKESMAETSALLTDTADRMMRLLLMRDSHIAM